MQNLSNFQPTLILASKAIPNNAATLTRGLQIPYNFNESFKIHKAFIPRIFVYMLKTEQTVCKL